MSVIYSCVKRNLLLLFFISLVLFFDSCNTSEEITPSVSESRQWFEKSLGNTWDAWPLNVTIKSIDWNHAISNERTIEVPVELENQTTGQFYAGKESKKSDLIVRLVLWEKEEGYEASLVQLVHQGGNIPNHLSRIEESGFTGLVISNRGGGNKKAAMFTNGEGRIFRDKRHL